MTGCMEENRASRKSHDTRPRITYTPKLTCNLTKTESFKIHLDVGLDRKTNGAVI